MSIAARETALLGLVALVAGAYPWKTGPSRRLKLWSDVAAASRPACFLFEGGGETYLRTASGLLRRSLDVKLFAYLDAKDPAAIGATAINAIMDALDDALAPAGADIAGDRTTLGGAAYDCRIEGRPLKDPGDLDGDALLIVPIRIILP